MHRPSSPEAAKMQHAGALRHLTAKPLAKQLCDIGFVVNEENTETHATLPSARDRDCRVAPLRREKEPSFRSGPQGRARSYEHLLCQYKSRVQSNLRRVVFITECDGPLGLAALGVVDRHRLAGDDRHLAIEPQNVPGRDP